jgi:hypothetical protein
MKYDKIGKFANHFVIMQKKLRRRIRKIKCFEITGKYDMKYVDTKISISIYLIGNRKNYKIIKKIKNPKRIEIKLDI